MQLVLGHALLTTTQLYLTPRKEDVIRRILAHHAEQVRQARQRVRPAPRRVTGPRAWMCCSGADVVTAGAAAAAPAERGVARARFAPRPVPPLAGRLRRRQEAHEQLTARRRAGRRRAAPVALGALLDWLQGQEGGSWQQRWLASGSDAAGAAWRQLPGGWLNAVRTRCPAGPALFSALITAISAGIVRPSLAWLAAADASRRPARAMSALRDPEGFARLRALCDGGSAAACLPRPAPARCNEPRSSWPPRAACSPTSPSGISLSCWTPRQTSTAARSESAASLPAAPRMGYLRPGRAARLRQLRTAGQRTPGELIDRYQLTCRPIRDLLVDYLRERQPALDYGSLEQLAAAWACSGRTSSPPSRHRQPAPECPGRRRLETAHAHQAADHYHAARRQDRDQAGGSATASS